MNRAGAEKDKSEEKGSGKLIYNLDSHLDDVPECELLRLDGQLLAVAEAEGVLRHQAGEALHDLGGLVLLVEGEDAGDDHHEGQHHAQVQVVVRRLLQGGGLDAVGQEAEHRAQPQQHREPAEERLEELDPDWRGGRRRQGVGAVPLEVDLGLGLGEAGLGAALVLLVQLLRAQPVVRHLQLLLQVVQVLIFNTGMF